MPKRNSRQGDQSRRSSSSRSRSNDSNSRGAKPTRQGPTSGPRKARREDDESSFRKSDSRAPRKNSGDKPFGRSGDSAGRKSRPTTFGKPSSVKRADNRFRDKDDTSSPRKTSYNRSSDKDSNDQGKRFGAKKPGFNKSGDDSKRFSKPADKRSFSKKQDSSERPFRSSTRGSDSRFRSEGKSDNDARKPFRRKEEGGDSPRKFGDKRSDSGFPKRGEKYSDKGGSKRSSRDEKSDRPFSKRPTERRFDADKKDSAPVRRTRRGFKTEAETPYQRELPAQTEKIRLNRFIANSGVCSRREADELITMGLISVNGKTITELGYKVNPGDEVRYESRVLRAEKPVYILLNKPKGYLTTTSDPQERNTVMHLIGDKVRERIYPVGRLDRNTTGLLLLTNDGDLADKLMHPSYNVKKIYKVELDKALTKADYQKILEGVQLEEGKAMVDDLAIVSDDGKTVGIELHIGWNRVVRRIFEALDYTVIKLDRSVYAGLDKKELSRGQWRFLRKEEVIMLKHYK